MKAHNSHFITKKETAKLDLLNLLLTSKEKIFVKEAMFHLHVSKNSALRYLEELARDIRTVSNTTKLILSQRGYYYLENSSQDGNLILMQVKEHYIAKSSVLLTFKSVIQTSHTVENLANSLHFTSSTIYNKIAEINKITNLFNCSVNISQTDRFSGDEFGIRAFNFIMLHYSTRTNIDNPFSSMMPKSFINLDNIKENLITQKNLSPSQEMRLKLLQGIVLYRINKRKRFVTFDDSFFTDAQFFFEDDFILQNQLGREFETTIKLESNIFCFLVRSLFFNIDTFTKKTEIVSQYKNSNLTITQQINFILSEFSTYASFKYTQEGYIESYYLLLIIFIFVKHINIDFTDFYEFKSDLVNYEDTIETSFSENEKMITEFLTREPFKTQFSQLSEPLKMHLSRVLYFIFDSNHLPKKVKIYVQFSKNMYTGSTLITSLKTTFSQDSIEITDNPNDADLIISDIFEGYNLKAERFYFENVYDYSQWKQLLQCVTDLIYRKSFFKTIS